MDTTQRRNNHQEVESVKDITIDQDGMRRENNMEAVGGIQGTQGDIRVAQ